LEKKMNEKFGMGGKGYRWPGRTPIKPIGIQDSVRLFYIERDKRRLRCASQGRGTMSRQQLLRGGKIRNG